MKTKFINLEVDDLKKWCSETIIIAGRNCARLKNTSIVHVCTKKVIFDQFCLKYYRIWSIGKGFIFLSVGKVRMAAHWHAKLKFYALQTWMCGRFQICKYQTFCNQTMRWKYHQVFRNLLLTRSSHACRRLVECEAPTAIVLPVDGTTLAVTLREGDISWNGFLANADSTSRLFCCLELRIHILKEIKKDMHQSHGSRKSIKQINMAIFCHISFSLLELNIQLLLLVLLKRKSHRRSIKRIVVNTIEERRRWGPCGS
mgnify:CR=1 FL=1